MNFPIKLVPFFLAAAGAIAATDNPWAKPRDISAFQALLDRSPFSLPTAEESSPLAERYSLTGAAALDGEALVFVLDKTTQERHILSKQTNKQNMGLVEYLPDPDPRRMRATIRVNGEIATISYAEPAQQPVAPGVPPQPGISPQPGSPSAVRPPVAANVRPGAPVASNSPAIQQQNPAQQGRKVIRRRVISGQPPAGQ